MPQAAMLAKKVPPSTISQAGITISAVSAVPSRVAATAMQTSAPSTPMTLAAFISSL
jgi:hypothetical protein